MPFGQAKLTPREWLISILLLLATMLNYMDRQTLSNVATRVKTEFHLTNEQYGNVEADFSYAFAAGSLFFGFVADRCSVRWLYPAVLILWSSVGVLTGFVKSYEQLLACRVALGFFEAGHWPCALVTTHRLISAEGRTFANSLLQSGASLGAILTPVVIILMVLNSTQPDVWRLPFFVIGALGVLWVAAWLLLLPKQSFAPIAPSGSSSPQHTENTGAAAPRRQEGHWLELLIDRRFWALAIMVVSINVPWQLIRAWLPQFLQKGRNYTETFALGFNSSYYIATDIGCVIAGAVVSILISRKWTAHTARLLVFTGCACLTSLTVLAANTPTSGFLLGVLLVVGAASLGLFPCYYSFTQSLSSRHVGTATGLLATIGWVASGPVQTYYGQLIDKTKSFDLGLGIAGCVPFLGAAAMFLLWPSEPDPSPELSELNAKA